MGRSWHVCCGGEPVVRVSILLVVLLSVVSIGKVAAQSNGVTLTNETSFTPFTNVYINCGSSSNATIQGVGIFSADDNPSYVSQGILATDSAPSNVESTYTQLLETARIFTTISDYKIPVSVVGRVWLRMWFSPITTQNFSPSNALFSVTANDFTLLNNSTGNTSGSPSGLFVEYLINVTSGSLVITFKPEGSGFAFVNGLAVVSAPDDLLSSSLTLVPNQPYLFSPSTSLETLYRLNVGGSLVTAWNDSFLTRQWNVDTPYVYAAFLGTPLNPAPEDAILYPRAVPEYIAPRSVYATARVAGANGATNLMSNLTWTFVVDPGYFYYVRLHFAELVYSAVNERVFDVYLSNQTALSAYDAFAEGGYQKYGASYQDFVVDMRDPTYDKLWLQMSPSRSQSSLYADVILNGLEIFKINNTNGSLEGSAVVLPPISSLESGAGKKMNTGTIVGAAVGGVVVLVVLVAGICCICSRRSKGHTKHSSPAWLPLPLHGGNSESRTASKISATTSHKSGTGSYVSSATSDLGRHFTFSELQDATNDFDDDLLLGVGGFGKVYKAQIDDNLLVAVKRGNPRSEQGLTEFQTEIELLSKLRHRHLVSLIGYCEEHCEMILVYDYMANGPLRGHLYGTDLPPLPWKQRLEICVGAARGLHYLHTGAAQGIIHRDVKTTNILLDDNFVAKVADFGLSKTGPSLDRTHVSTAVKGSFGYLDPEYFRRQQLTEKSDVYSFGVVLMEVVCARPAINPALPREQVNIAEWAMQWQKMGMLEQIIDPKLVGYINPESLRKFGETAEKCLAEQGVDRPAMGDVLWNLEYALQLQENSMENRLMEGSTNRSLEMPLRTPEPEEPDLTTTNNSLVSEEDSEDATASAVFSQLMNPQGR